MRVFGCSLRLEAEGGNFQYIAVGGTGEMLARVGDDGRSSGEVGRGYRGKGMTLYIGSTFWGCDAKSSARSERIGLPNVGWTKSGIILDMTR